MKSFLAKKSDVEPKWLLVDATDLQVMAQVKKKVAQIVIFFLQCPFLSKNQVFRANKILENNHPVSANRKILNAFEGEKRQPVNKYGFP